MNRNPSEPRVDSGIARASCTLHVIVSRRWGWLVQDVRLADSGARRWPVIPAAQEYLSSVSQSTSSRINDRLKESYYCPLVLSGLQPSFMFLCVLAHLISSVSTMRRPFWLGEYRVGA